MTKRVYLFDLPYALSGIDVSVGINDLQNANLWNDVPKDLQDKLEAGSGVFSDGVQVTQKELDELPDPVWRFIAMSLNLAWKQVPSQPTSTPIPTTSSAMEKHTS